MISDEAAFLRTIIASPDDDTPRLVYADWLDENGHEDCAEFIRLQIELAKTPQFDGIDLGSNFSIRYRDSHNPETYPYTGVFVTGTVNKKDWRRALGFTLRIRFGLYEANAYVITRETNTRTMQFSLIPELKDGTTIFYRKHNDKSDALRERIKELGVKTGGCWQGIPILHFSVAEHVRGFVERLTCNWSDWFLHDPKDVTSITPLREVLLTYTFGLSFPSKIIKRALERCPGVRFTLMPMAHIPSGNGWDISHR